MRGFMVAAALLSLNASELAAAPPNDNFEVATVLPASWTTNGGSNVGASLQPGEPNHSPSQPPGGHSVWWKWTPNFSAQVKITTEGSMSTTSSDGFMDTQLGVYTGTALSSLTLVARNEDHTDFMHGWSRVDFNAVAGTTYYIAVDGWDQITGTIRLNLAIIGASPKYVLSLNVIPSGAGTITANPPQPGGGYDAGTVVTLQVAATGTNSFSSWTGGASGSDTTISVTMNSPKNVNAIFNSDHRILFQNSNSRQLAIWLMQGSGFLGSALVRNGQAVGAGWQSVGMADLNANGSSDLLFQHTDGRLAAWLMQGTKFLNAVLLRSTVASWRLVGAGNFGGSGSPDLLFQNTDRRVAIWLMDGTSFSSAVLVNGGTPIAAGWRAVGAADLTGDGKLDIVFQNSDGRTAIWQMNGTTFVSFNLVRNGEAATAGWSLNGLANFNNTSSTDFLWQHTDGRLAVWFMTNTNLAGIGGMRSTAPAWRAAGAQ